MAAFILVDDVPAAAQLFPHVGYLLAERSVLSLQEGGAHRDLVLLQPPSVPRTLRRLVVFHAPAPVLLVLSMGAAVWYVGVCGGEGEGRREEERTEWDEKGQLCDERKGSWEGRESATEQVTTEQDVPQDSGDVKSVQIW